MLFVSHYQTLSHSFFLPSLPLALVLQNNAVWFCLRQHNPTTTGVHDNYSIRVKVSASHLVRMAQCAHSLVHFAQWNYTSILRCQRVIAHSESVTTDTLVACWTICTSTEPVQLVFVSCCIWLQFLACLWEQAFTSSGVLRLTGYVLWLWLTTAWLDGRV